MKIEKINENQIRCTLNKADLADRQLRISELAYGTEKAKALFREMMQQASQEVGFEADDIPLMIEAIPVSPECLILVITKVEDPDELDTRFSKFSPDQNDESDLAETDGAYVDEIINCFDQINELLDDTASIPNGEPDSFIAAEHNKKDTETSFTEGETKIKTEMTKVFTFHNLEQIIALSEHLSHYYFGENKIYKNPISGLYYLCISKSEHSPEEFNKICNIVSEYGKPEKTTYATLEYYKEHFDCIVKSNAIAILSEI